MAPKIMERASKAAVIPSMLNDRDAQCGDCNGGRGSEETGKALGPDHLGNYSEKRNNDAADQKAGNEFSGWGG